MTAESPKQSGLLIFPRTGEKPALHTSSPRSYSLGRCAY